LEVRRYLAAHRVDLSRQAAGLYPDLLSQPGTPWLTRRSWLITNPVPLDQVELSWCDPPAAAIDGTEPEAASVRPVQPSGDRFARYSDAVGALAALRVFENRPVYRLADVGMYAGRVRLGFGLGRYFDSVDVGEAVAHEYAAVVRAGHTPALHDLPFRSRLGDPTDPVRRSMTTAITTVTIRRTTAGASFLLHWRDPAKVATNGDLYQVLPVGVFQPASTNPSGPDFDLWRNIVREFSEELTGAPEHDNVDYETWPLYVQLEHARRTGACRPYLLGLGVDPLSLATELLTAVSFDAAVFDELFGDVVSVNDEGTTTSVPFAEDRVRRLVEKERIQPAGAAALLASWQARDLLLGR
jgi:hypothetical protein